MATLEEASAQPGANDKAAGLIAAIGLISGEQTYTFTLYKRVVLPIDGFVFWVKAQNVDPAFLTPEEQEFFTFQSTGSLHLSQVISDEEETTYTAQSIAFTTKNNVEPLARVAPNSLYILVLQNGSRIAFGSQANHYQLAGLWHYRGRAVFSTFASQLIDDPSQLDNCEQIVSNSLPLWLAMSQKCAPIYPSFLTPLNLTPPYITADIQSTDAIGQTPFFDPTNSQSQLVTDVVKFTTFGLGNNAILDFQKMVLENSQYGNYGIMNMPVPVDEKIAQSEFQFIAQKKTMVLQVNYYQSRARAVARRLIYQALIGLTPVPSNFPVPFYV
jgi:hypothetical protein